MLYAVDRSADRARYRFVRNLQIAGNGLLKRHVQRRERREDGTLYWTASAAELLSLTPEGAAGYAIVIDLKPRQAGAVSLYELRTVWGVSAPDWTPIALHLHGLYVDHPTEAPATFKASFPEPEHPPQSIGEFLYLQGGTEKGTWNWGMVGRVNGALLWPEAFRFLTEGLQSALCPAAVD